MGDNNEIGQKNDKLEGEVKKLEKEVNDLKNKVLEEIKRYLKIESIKREIFSGGVLIFGGILLWKIVSSITLEKSFVQNLPFLILALIIAVSVISLIAILNRRED